MLGAVFSPLIQDMQQVKVGPGLLLGRLFPRDPGCARQPELYSYVGHGPVPARQVATLSSGRVPVWCVAAETKATGPERMKCGPAENGSSHHSHHVFLAHTAQFDLL